MKLNDHPTVRAYRATRAQNGTSTDIVAAQWLKKTTIEAGADDAGVIDLRREALADERGALKEVMPGAAGIVVLAIRLNQSAIQCPAHSVADLEFKQAMARANESGRNLTAALHRMGVKALNIPAGFPYEAGRWPEKMWFTSDKRLAVEAGLGHMGWNRLLLHPQFGAAVVLGSVLMSARCDAYDQPLDFNPCIQCGLCLKACPVGAVKRSDDFDFSACYSHNYRERLGGFLDWIEQLADSKNRFDYRRRVADHETISMWQNLSIGAQTRCDRCMAVCPAGQVSIGDYLENRKSYVGRYLKPSQAKVETVYVVKGSDAEQHVGTKFPHKRIKHISNGLRPISARHFLDSLPLAFQGGQSKGLDAVFHFSFTGEEETEGTVTIQNKTIEVRSGLTGNPDLHVSTDSRAWIRFLSKEMSLVRMLLTRKLKLKGAPKLMGAFARCFPS